MLAPHDLNLRHLRAIALIRASGSVSAAAVRANLSQPALTQGLAKLEAQLGLPLFERRPEGVSATAAGDMLIERTDAAFAHLSAPVRKGPRAFVRPERLMTAAQLRGFLALADAGSFVGAAAVTGISQPALHRAVRDLEAVIGTVLIERRGRGVALNAAGRRLARGIRLATGEIAAGIAEVRDPSGEEGSITVGAMPLSRAALLPNAIARLSAERRDMRFSIIEGSWRDLIEPLRDGAIDLMVGALRPDPIVDLEQAPLHQDHLAIVAGAHHPLADIPEIDPASFARYPWIVGHPGSPRRARWEALFADGPLPPRPVECGSVMTIRGLLTGGDFLTLLSPAQVALEVASGVLVQIGAPLGDSARTIGIITRRGWRPTGSQRRFLDLLGELSRSLP